MSSEDNVRRSEFLVRFLEDAISHSQVNDRVIPDRLKADVGFLKELGLNAPDGWYAPALRVDMGWVETSSSTFMCNCTKCDKEEREKFLRRLYKSPRAPTIGDMRKRYRVELSPQRYHDPRVDPWTGMAWDYTIYVGQCWKCLTIHHAQAERRAKAR